VDQNEKPKPTGRVARLFAIAIAAGWVVMLALYAAQQWEQRARERQTSSPSDAVAKIALDAKERIERLIARRETTLPGTPDLTALDERLRASGHRLGAPVLVRIYKQERVFELWLEKAGKFERFARYPICQFSGALGPKLKEGDRQAPEGFYTVDASQLKPDSRWHRAFNLGFPNVHDRAHGRTGSFLMVHGGCTSIGCYAMTDAVIDEIWLFVTRAIAEGQRRFQVQAFPFRMTEANLARRASSPWHGFWSDLKRGADLFEATNRAPEVAVCEGRYVFRADESRSSTPQELSARCFPQTVTAAPERKL
jgi:murein L,D-transpeptidase YafK